MRNVIPLVACLVSVGCTSSPSAQHRSESYAIYITGYDVPPPMNVPYSNELGQREYLRFYHQAYLTTMWQDWPAHSTISPISDYSQAAIAGHYDGQHDADMAKRVYWAKRGREYGVFVGRDNHRLQLTGDARESTISSAGADEGVPPRAAGN